MLSLGAPSLLPAPSGQCTWVSWLQGRSSPLIPALAAYSCSVSPTHLLFLCKCLFWVSLMSALLLSFHWSSLLPVPSHYYSASSFPLLYSRYNQSWLPFMPFAPQDHTCSICMVSSLLLLGLQLLPLQCIDFLATETLSIPSRIHSSLWKFVLVFQALLNHLTFLSGNFYHLA